VPSGATVTGTVPQDNAAYLEDQIVTVKANTGGLVSVTHNFLGWATVNNAAAPDYAVVGSTVSPPTFNMGVADVTLFAVWEAIPMFTVTYQRNGATSGAAPVDNNMYQKGATVTVLDKNTLARENYTFLGWNVNSSSSTVQYMPLQTFILEDSVVLYAVWQENTKYSVIYNGNGATGGSAPVDPNSPYFAGAMVTVLNQGSLAQGGYEFLGWATSASALTPLYRAGDTFQIGSANVILYAVWQYIPNTYTVTYSANWPILSGLGAPPVDNNLYLAGATVEVLANSNNLVLEGYRFRGWATSATASTPTYVVTGSTVTPASFQIGSVNVVLHAVWELIKTYTVTYHENGADSGLPPFDINTYEQGATVTVKANTANLVKNGYVLAGWSINSNATVPTYAINNNGFVDPATFTMGTVNVNLYAVWSLIVMHSVTYHANGATSGDVPQNTNQYMPGSIVVVRPNSGDLKRTGYKLLGWAYSSTAMAPVFELNGDVVSPSHFTITSSSVVLYAVWWLIPTFSVTYNANWPNGEAGVGTPPTDPTMYYTGQEVTVKGNINTPPLSKQGYTYLGWMYNNIFFSVDINGEVTPAIFHMGDSNAVLFAVWNIIPEKPPYNYVHYGEVENTKILIRATYVDTKNKSRAELINPVLSQLLVMATEWVHGYVAAAGVTVPFDTVPDGIAHICELYAAGRFLQRETPEEKTHPYIDEATVLIDRFLELKYGVAEGVVDKQPSVVIVSANTGWWY
jgi:hypothetical protein